MVARLIRNFPLAPQLSYAVGAGASFTGSIGGAASKRSVITIVANDREVILTHAKVFAGSPITNIVGDEIEHGLVNQGNAIAGSPISESSSELTGLNMVPGVDDPSMIFPDLGGDLVVTYQAFVGRRGNTSVGAGFLSIAKTRVDDPSDFLMRECAGGLLRIPIGCTYFFACTTTNLAIRGDFKGYEIFDSKPFAS